MARLKALRHAGRTIRYTVPGEAPARVTFGADGHAELPEAHARHLASCGVGVVEPDAPRAPEGSPAQALADAAEAAGIEAEDDAEEEGGAEGPAMDRPTRRRRRTL